jgi:hypothetical protein
MSATNIVVFEKDGQVGSRLSGSLADLPARLRETRRRDGFVRALAAAPFPIAVVALDADLTAGEVQELLLDARNSQAACIVVADPSGAVESMECRELGALALLPRDYPREKWRALIERLIADCQSKTRSAG